MGCWEGEGFPSPSQHSRLRLFHLVQNGPGRIGGDGGLGDGAAYDEEIAADAHGLRGRHDAALVVGSGAGCRADTGRQAHQAGAAGFDGFDFVAGADHAVQTPRLAARREIGGKAGKVFP